MEFSYFCVNFSSSTPTATMAGNTVALYQPSGPSQEMLMYPPPVGVRTGIHYWECYVNLQYSAVYRAFPAAGGYHTHH